MSVTRVIRKARKAHRCDGCGMAGRIQPGDAYLTHTALRGDEFGYGDQWPDGKKMRPQRFAECADCAFRAGRGETLNPVLDGQTTIDDVMTWADCESCGHPERDHVEEGCEPEGRCECPGYWGLPEGGGDAVHEATVQH